MGTTGTHKLLVTGGAGFIGSNLVRFILENSDWMVINADKLTYAAHPDSLHDIKNHKRYLFEHTDLCDFEQVNRLFARHRPHAVMNLAAETHVDRSIAAPVTFIQSNILGTYHLLEASRIYWATLQPTQKSLFRFHHISTDETYGDLGPHDQPFTEDTPYAPHSPYAASKASCDHLVGAWHTTYGLPTLISICSNNYGPFQSLDKLIPLTIVNAVSGKPLPVYGTGANIRDWLFVQDHVRALLLVLGSGQAGRTYNIGGGNEKTNLEVVSAICSFLDAVLPQKSGPRCQLIQFVSDRPGHDRRYAINCARITDELGWKPLETFQSGLHKTIQWYLDNPAWMAAAQSSAYRAWMQTNYADRSVSQ